jgi:hypothetical protein
MAGRNTRVALILNAGDLWGDQTHAYRVIEQTEMFAETGMEVTDVDLREYVDRQAALEQCLRTYGSVCEPCMTAALIASSQECSKTMRLHMGL